MKYNKILVLVLLFVFAFSLKLNLFAQNDEEYSPEEWQRQMDELGVKKHELQVEIISLYEEADSLNKVIAEKEAEFERELNHLYSWVGSTKSGVADFRNKFELLEKSINSKSGTKEEQIKKLEEIEASKIKCLPEFWDRYQAMKKKTDVWDNEGGAHKLMKGNRILNILKIRQLCRDIKFWSAILKAKKAFNKNAMDLVPGKAMKVSN